MPPVSSWRRNAPLEAPAIKRYCKGGITLTAEQAVRAAPDGAFTPSRLVLLIPDVFSVLEESARQIV